MPLPIQENVSLAPLTTLNIGGNARYFIKAETETTVVEAVEYAAEKNLRLFILGGGSNVLIADAGFDGIVLQIAPQGYSKLGTRNSQLTTIAAGEDWDEFVAYCVVNELAGVENLSGIPGRVGGTPVQNVGAYGQEVSETIENVRCFDRKTMSIVTLSNVDCGFSYRKSIFNSTMRDRYVVLSVTYKLKRGGQPKIVYKDLIEYFDGRSPDLAETREAVLNIRRLKSMVIEPDDPNSKSAGSFFKNPVVSRSKLAELQMRNRAIPYFEFGDGVKIPAAWLIEKAGFGKGFTHGRAGISSRHTLALINCGNASAAEIIELKELIQNAVENRFGIPLHPEPVFVGF